MLNRTNACKMLMRYNRQGNIETVCLLVNQKAKHHINIGIDIEEYDQIKNR